MAPTTTSPSFFTLPDGRTICYRLSPAENRPTVLLAGMLATTGAVWDYVVGVLHAAGFRTLAYDHPGHGGSSPPAVLSANTFETMADDVLTLIQAVVPASGKGPLLHAWVGCSLGAATGVVFAARHPGVLHHLVVCDTGSQSPHVAGVPDAFTPRVKATRAIGNLNDALEGTRARWLGHAWLNDPANAEQAQWLAALMAETTLDGYEGCIAALLAPTFDLAQAAPRVAANLAPDTGRVLVMVGEKDEPLPAAMETLAEQIRAGFVKTRGEAAAQAAVQFVVVPNAGHACFIDGFDVWRQTVVPFLAS